MTLIPSNNHEGIAIICIGAVFGALSILCFTLRIWSRRIKGVSLDWSDYTLFAALVLAVGLIGGTVNTVIQGLGLEADRVSIEQLINLSKGLIIGILLWVFSSSLVRISILLLYNRLFVEKTFRHMSYILICLNIVYVIVVVVVTFTICQPFAYNWNKAIPGGHCGGILAFYTWMGVWNLISDTVTVILPLPTLWKLQLPLRKKVVFSAVFSVGFIICALTIVRTVQTTQASTSNPTKDYASIGVLSLLEPLLGICTASVPLFGPVFHRVFGTTFFDDGKAVSPNQPAGYGSEEGIAARKIRLKRMYRSVGDFDTTMDRSKVDHDTDEYHERLDSASLCSPSANTIDVDNVVRGNMDV